MADQEKTSLKSGQKMSAQPDGSAAAANELEKEASPAPEAGASPAPDPEAASASEPRPPAPTDRKAPTAPVPAVPGAVSNPCACESETSSSTVDCNPCSDPIATANRVIRDPKVSTAVSELLGAAAQSVKGRDSTSEKKGLSARVQKSVEGALEGIAKAFAGKDAVRAKGESCGGQLRLFFEIQDPVTGKSAPLDAQLASKIVPRLIDRNWNLAANTPTFDGESHVFRDVEPGFVRVGLAAEIADGGEISPQYEVKNPTDTKFQPYQRQPASSTGTAAAVVELTSAVPDNEAIVFTAVLSTAAGSIAPTGTVSFNSYFDEAITSKPLAKDSVKTVKNGQATCTVELDQIDSGSYAITATYSGDANYAPATSNPLVEGAYGQYYLASLEAAPAAGAPTATAEGVNLTQGFQASIFAGLETRIKLILIPPAAHVRCFSWLEGEGAGCLQGKQYISRVAISAMQGDNFVACKSTGESGCSGFKLNPGWYTFSAPEDITIEGCNYTLSTDSPISAFVGAGQCCSDIFFRYKKKGNEIEVISKICFVDTGNPNKEVNTNFAGMQYLLLRDNDPAFVQQQTASDGSALRFRNLAAGAYLLLCQAPATYGSQPVQPIYPQAGRLALTIFAGQTSAVPVLVTFRTGITAPAVLDGYVRDETGQSIPGQVVLVVNFAGCVIAAAVTDATGFYSIQIYQADNLTIVWGSQKITVSKSQIQAAMKTVGTPALPSPGAAMELAMQSSDLVKGI